MLGFYDEPVSVYVERPRPPRRAFDSVKDSHNGHSRTRPLVSTAVSLVQDLWDSTEIHAEALERWVPNVVARRKLGTRNLRTATVVWSLVGAVVLAVVAWMTIVRPGLVAAEADAVLESDAAGVVSTLDPLDQLARSLGESAQPDLVVSTATVLEAEAAARALFTSAGELGDADEEIARRERAADVAGRLLDISSRSSRLVAYRLSAEQALFVPDLPTDPSAADISAVTGRIAQWRSQVDGIVVDLPSDVLPAERAKLVAWGTGLQAWQEYYLDAMREGDAATMGAAVTTKADQVAGLRSDLLEALRDAGTEMAASVAEVRASLEALVAG
ncbi:MAG: hypothetical protein ACRDVD_05680 [Acidimicrobiia bacterium]